MVSRAIWKNIHSWDFQRLEIALVLRTRAISIVFEKLTRACFFQIACTRNHTITYTDDIHEKISSFWLAESSAILGNSVQISLDFKFLIKFSY